MVIQLGKYGSAVFIADMKFREARVAKPVSAQDLLPKVKWIPTKDGHTFKTIGEPNYTDKMKCREDYYKYHQIRKEWIYNYLKEHYSNTDYAEKFLEKEKEWDLPLRYPTPESKTCDCHTDENHCNIQRKGGCYTCAFVCWTGKVCDWCNCKLLKENKNE